MIVTRKGVASPLEGELVNVGEKAPDFTAKDLDNNEVSLSDFDEAVLLSVFPDINTSVCAAQTHHFFKDASKFEGVKIVNISNNTVDDLKDWCAVNGVDALMLSDENLEFAKAYGLYMPEFEVLARSVFVIDKDGTLVYSEIVPEMVDEPNYDKALEAVRNL